MSTKAGDNSSPRSEHSEDFTREDVVENVYQQRDGYMIGDDLPVRLTKASGDISEVARYVASQAGADVDIGTGEKLQLLRNSPYDYVFGEDGLDSLNEELPELNIFAAKMVAEEENFDPDEIYVEDSGRDEEPEWFREIGIPLLEYVYEDERALEKDMMLSKQMSRDLPFKTKQIGFTFSKMEEKSGIDITYNDSKDPNRWDLDKLRSELDIEKILEEGWDAV